jgi:hypothetical protein
MQPCTLEIIDNLHLWPHILALPTSSAHRAIFLVN